MRVVGAASAAGATLPHVQRCAVPWRRVVQVLAAQLERAVTADERTALIAAGWNAALCPELPGAWWRHPARGPFVYSTQQALAMIGYVAPDVERVPAPSRPTPTGWCECGCGQRTKLSTKTRLARGHIKGEPHRYINGHQVRTRTRQVPAREAAA